MTTLDEDEFLRAFEDELGEVRREVDRISAMSVQPDANPSSILAALRTLRNELAEKARSGSAVHGQIDGALVEAFDKILADGTVTDAAGNVAFRLDTSKLKSHAKTILGQLVDAMRENLWSKLGRAALAKAAPNLAPALAMDPDEPARAPDPDKPHKELTAIDFAAVVGSIFLPRPDGKKKP